MKTYFLSLFSFLTINFAHSMTIDSANQPSLGSAQAPVQVVAFLEPKCPDSKKYHNSSFSKLSSEYIDTNKIRYSVITTSFLSQSMPAAIGLLCVYNQNPNPPHADIFFKFLSYIYKNQPPERDNWATLENVLKFAGDASDAIDREQLKTCIESKHYLTQIEKNTAYGNQVMGHLSTPTIYVDGIKVENIDDTIDYETLKAAIEKALKER